MVDNHLFLCYNIESIVEEKIGSDNMSKENEEIFHKVHVNCGDTANAKLIENVEK